MPTKTSSTIVDRRWAVNFQGSESGKKYLEWDKWLNTSTAQCASLRTDDGPVPGFSLKIRQGLNATSGLYGERVTYDFVKGHVAFGMHNRFSPDKTWTWNFTYGNNTYGGPTTVASVAALSTTVQNEAKRKFIAKCISEQTAFNGGQFIGELRETLHMIRHPAQSLRKGIDSYLNALKRRRRGSRSSKRKILADTWLEYQYGWAPLISDIASASKQLNRFQVGRPPFKMVVSTATGSSALVTTFDGGSGNLEMLINEKNEQISFVKYFGVVNINLAPGLAMGDQNLGFRWDQFVPTVWELVPYSFLVDYFTNIGDILQSWSYATSNLRWAGVTTVRHNYIVRVVGSHRWKTSVDPAFETEWIDRPGLSRASARIVSRSPTAGSLVPSFELQLPSPGSLKWLNLAALAQNVRKMTPY